MTQEERILTLDCASENLRNDLKGHDRRMSSAYRMIEEVEEKGMCEFKKYKHNIK